MPILQSHYRNITVNMASRHDKNINARTIDFKMQISKIRTRSVLHNLLRFKKLVCNQNRTSLMDALSACKIITAS